MPLPDDFWDDPPLPPPAKQSPQPNPWVTGPNTNIHWNTEHTPTQGLVITQDRPPATITHAPDGHIYIDLGGYQPLNTYIVGKPDGTIGLTDSEANVQPDEILIAIVTGPQDALPDYNTLDARITALAAQQIMEAEDAAFIERLEALARNEKDATRHLPKGMRPPRPPRNISPTKAHGGRRR